MVSNGCRFALVLFCLFNYTASGATNARVLFYDDFNSHASYHRVLTKNATTQEYKDNSLPEGHLLKKWNYSWDYDPVGYWKQAFYVVPAGKDYMEQAGRSAGYVDCRITADVNIPAHAQGYTIELKQYKNDNDPLYYVIGADKTGHDGIEFGYENQIPRTDHTVKDAYLRGTFCEGIFKPDQAFFRRWVDVVIDVNVPRRFVTWKMKGQIVAQAYCMDLKPGGYFGIYMSYERGTRFADVKITAYEEAPQNAPELEARNRSTLTPGRVYEEKDGYVAAEVEDLGYSTVWQKNDAVPAGFSGTGWLKYIGPIMGEGDPDNRYHDADPTDKHQGHPKDWLIWWVKLNTPGKYHFKAHVTHKRHDGDNDAWIGLVQQYDGLKMGDNGPAARSIPARWGDSKALGRFDWNSWGPTNCRFFVQKPGVYGIYVAGRSQGFGVDRFVLYRDGQQKKALALPPTLVELKQPKTAERSYNIPTAADITVAFDDPQQDWDGYGVNYVEAAQTRDYAKWPQDYGAFSLLSERERQEIIQMIFGPDGLKPSLVKMFLDSLHEGMDESGNDNDDPMSINLAGYDHETTTKNMRYFVREGLRVTRAQGRDLTIIGTMYGPQPWVTKQRMLRGRDLDPAMKYEAAEYLCSWAKFLREKEGLPLKFISLHNEGEARGRWREDGRDDEKHHNHDYNMYWPPEQVVDFLCFTREILDRNGLQEVGLAPGETTHWGAFHSYARAIVANPLALKNMALITSHGFNEMYGDPVATIRKHRPELHAWTTSGSWGKMKFWWLGRMHEKIYGIGLNGHIPWACIQRHSQWVGGDPNPGTAFLVDDNGDYTVLRGYYQYKQFTTAGRPGMKVAAISSDTDKVIVFAWASNNTDNPDAFVVCNSVASPVRLSIRVTGSASQAFRTVRTTFGEVTENYQTGETVNLDGDQLNYTAPAFSVTTFYGN